MRNRVCLINVLNEPWICEIQKCTSIVVTVHQVIEVFTKLIENIDKYTKNHSEIVAVVSYIIALRIGLPAKACDFIHLAGHLHDVGKLTLPKKILIKPGPLDKQEWELIKSHPKIGFDLLSPVKLFQGQGGVLEMILYHHERWDGKGYPFGLKGKEIPLGARIISIADAFSAMVCERPYRKPLSFDEALEEIKKGAGTQFDPMLVGIFVNIYEEITNWAKGFIS